MKITRRDNSKSGRFSVSVNTRQSDMIEDALTYLENTTGKKYSQLIVDLVLANARDSGWKHEPVTAAAETT